MKHEGQGFEQYPLIKAYEKEENAVRKICKHILKMDVLATANIIDSHTIYKVEQENNRNRISNLGLLMATKMISKMFSPTYCSTCSPPSLRFSQSIATFLGWIIFIADDATAFAQTGRTPTMFIYDLRLKVAFVRFTFGYTKERCMALSALLTNDQKV